jgi:hypothetical protein
MRKVIVLVSAHTETLRLLDEARITLIGAGSKKL